MSMVTTMMMVVGDHEYEYDDDTSDATLLCYVLLVKFAIKAPLDKTLVHGSRKAK